MRKTEFSTQFTNGSPDGLELGIIFCGCGRGNHPTMFKSSGKIGHGIYDPFSLLKKRYALGSKGIYDEPKEIRWKSLHLQ